MTKSRNLYLYLAVFASGMTSLAVEMGASRLLGSVFGTSNIVWANVIGLMLLYLTVGYFIGGRWADRSPYPQTLYRILIWGAFLSALIPLGARPLLHAAGSALIGVDAGVVLGSFIAVLILFSIPVTLLGTVSPFAIRLAVTDVTNAGKTSGRVYAISTLGSILGTFLPVLWLIPTLGTIQTFLVFAAFLYLVGLVGVWRIDGTKALRFLWMPIAIAVLTVFVLNGTPLRAPLAGANLLYEAETPYNYVQVQEDGAGNRYLFLNEGEGVHSQWNANQYEYGRTWDYFLTAPYFNAPPFAPGDVHSLAILGLAGGTIARQYTHVYGDVPIDGIEIDPGIVEAGEKYFGLDEMPNLNIYVEDGRYELNKLKRKYSVVGIDAYRPPYIPFHLTTVEFFEEVRSHLEDNGAVVVNVGRTDTDRRLIDAMSATLAQVFPSVYAMDVPRSFNTILVATVQPTDAENLSANLAALPADAALMLRDTLALAEKTLVPVHSSDLVFTDNRAPVESLVDSLVVNFLLSGGADQLRPEGNTMITSNGRLRVAQAYIVVVFPILLVLIAARLVMTPLFLEVEYNRADFPADPFGFTQQDRLTYAPYALNYLLNGAGIEYLGDLKFPGGGSLYQADELRHMRDVKTLTQIAFGLAVVVGLVAIWDAYYLFRHNRERLRRAFFYGSLLTLALVAAIIIAALIDWEGFFVGFHELFFTNGTWYFPTSDTLIRLFPEQFWFDAALTIGGITVVTSLVVFVVSWRVKTSSVKTSPVETPSVKTP